MKLSKLLKNINVKSEYVDVDVLTITDKFDDIKEGSVFICIEGKRFDAHSLAHKAFEKGAAAVVTEKKTGAKNEVLVDKSRIAYTLMCSNFYDNPSEKLKMIGITGTNGKTSISFLIKSILEHCGHKVGLIGTVANYVGDTEYPSNLTTPEPLELQEMFNKMAKENCEYCVMEVSSQALEQGRVAGCNFEVGVFTNLTQDHLDYHGSMENYKAAKHILFENSEKSVINMDDEVYQYMIGNTNCLVQTYSIKNDSANFTAKNVKLRDDGVSYELVGEGVIGRVNLNIPGEFSVYNSMAAAIACIEAGMKFEDVIDALGQTGGVKGRMETVDIGKDFTVIIDYAHSPDGLKNIISAARAVYKNKIITVFGCGGDRDKTKRPIMGKVVGDMSDVAIVTSDNPRSEDPDLIVDDILQGMKNVNAKVIPIVDRKEAIEKALKIAKSGDVVLLAGKGHETYQVISTGKIHFDEREIIADILKK